MGKCVLQEWISHTKHQFHGGGRSELLIKWYKENEEVREKVKYFYNAYKGLKKFIEKDLCLEPQI